MINFILILTAIALVLLNAFFVAAEFGMVKLRETRIATIKKTYGLRGKILGNVHAHLDAYLSACQLGITLASLGLGWVGEPAFARVLMPLFTFLGIVSPELITLSAFFVAFSLISFLHIVLGELMPKSIAIRRPETISIWSAIPLYGFYWVMYPAIWLLNSCSNILLKILGFDVKRKKEYFYSTDEIKLILSGSQRQGELTKEETEILEHTLDFADLRVTDVMRSADEMIVIDTGQSVAQIMQTVMEKRYSRYPVYDAQKHEIVGIIHIKDLFAALYQQGQLSDLQAFIRPVLKVSQRLPALSLLRKFREGMPHFALVYRENELLGFVTLDNLLHILIGYIKDEFHRTQDDWRINPDGSLTVRGDCSVFSLERALNRDIDVGEEKIETVTGLILDRLGGLPKQGEQVNFKEFKAVIEKMRGYRITKIRIYPKKERDE